MPQLFYYPVDCLSFVCRCIFSHSNSMQFVGQLQRQNTALERLNELPRVWQCIIEKNKNWPKMQSLNQDRKHFELISLHSSIQWIKTSMLKAQDGERDENNATLHDLPSCPLYTATFSIRPSKLNSVHEPGTGYKDQGQSPS